MPYSFPDNIPKVAQSWTEDEQRSCIAAANAVLAEGGEDAEQNAIFACIHAAGRSEQSDEKQGLGLGGGPLTAGPGGYCMCPACGHKEAHEAGQPCDQMVVRSAGVP